MAFFKKAGNLSGSMFILFMSFNRTFLTRFHKSKFSNINVNIDIVLTIS